ncbi:hypothetical protein MPC1_3020006 [Methylocella tundrae]|nr:hypothetical protein MPC1_3020006 [Methylocella tundrae]
MDDYRKYVLDRAGGGNGKAGKKERALELERAPQRQSAPSRKESAPLKKRIWAVEERMRKFQDLIERVDKALAHPASFAKDPAKAAQLSAQRSELEKTLLLAEEEWLELTGQFEAAQTG